MRQLLGVEGEGNVKVVCYYLNNGYYLKSQGSEQSKKRTGKCVMISEGQVAV